MGQTVEIKRDGRVLIGATDLIHSPDDDGYYFHQADFRRSKCRTSKVYKTQAQAMTDWLARKVKWDDWY